MGSGYLDILLPIPHYLFPIPKSKIDMRHWQFWWTTLILTSEYNPPRFVELMMLLLAMATLGLWGITDKWPFLGLSLSYVVGSSTSILVRETIAPSAYGRITQVTAVMLLIISFYCFGVFLFRFDLIKH